MDHHKTGEEGWNLSAKKTGKGRMLYINHHRAREGERGRRSGGGERSQGDTFFTIKFWRGWGITVIPIKLGRSGQNWT